MRLDSLGAVVYCLDLGRMRRFYRDGLLLEETQVDDGFVMLATGAGVLTLVQAPEWLVAEYPLAEPPERREDTPIKLSFPTPTIESARERAASHGGSIDDPSKEWSMGEIVVCDGVDPEGNVIQVRALQ